ncbi:hypothetical protein ABVB72_25945 [Rhizobium nepotum]|uniref:SbtR family transcriptional regulator n=1 Tax=Rhizobium nepotum TaxID=1035271 RepID=UPI00336A7369
MREWVEFAQSYRGVVTMMAAAHTNPASALYASCAAVHATSARLLSNAQAEGTARPDMNGDDLFAPRADHLVHLITSTVLVARAG